jgi:hypothetical protein
MRWLLAMAMGTLLVGVAAGQAPPRLERVSIEDGSGAARWTPAEATVEESTEFAGPDGKSLHFHIDVDYTTGQPDYPIGWPRMSMQPPAELQDWSRYDFLELVIHSETSRDSLPSTPLGFIAHTPDRAHEYSRTLTELKKGETTTIVIPLSEIPRHNLVPHNQFFISESNYRDKDVVDFYIDEIALTRYAEPGLSDCAPLQSIAFADAAPLGLRFRVLGIDEGQTGLVKATLKQGGTLVAEGQWELARGPQEVWFVPKQPLKPGEAQVEVTLGQSRWTGTMRIVASPYGEGGR